MSLLPPITAPPHDPLHWRLDGRAGWRLLAAPDRIEIDTGDQHLRLAPRPADQTALTAPDGSFGGLVPPRHIALADGLPVILDARSGQIHTLDPCRCDLLSPFRILPCFGGRGEGPRQLGAPSAIVVGGGNLYVVDQGRRRVAVVLLAGLGVRAFLAPPDPWTPVDAALDPACRLLVTDPQNGALHRWSRGGAYLGAWTGFGAVQHVTVDRAGRIYLHIDGEAMVRVLDTDGRELARTARRDALADRFAPLPFRTTPDGTLFLPPPCAGAFDARGRRVPRQRQRLRPTWRKSGEALIGPLDSRIDRCVWDRVELLGQLPPGTRVRVRTWTAHTELERSVVEAVPIERWPEVVAEAGDTPWDALIQAAPGRYLWLRIRLVGGDDTPRLRAVKVFYPRISLRRYLPAVFGIEPVAAEFTDRFLAIFDHGFRQIEATIDHQARLFDPRSAPASRDPSKDFLGWLASWVGVSLSSHWTVAERRRLLQEAPRLFPMRGTLAGLRRLLWLVLGLRPEPPTSSAGCAGCPGPRPKGWRPPPLILESFRLRRWLHLGSGRLGAQAVLWGTRIVGRTQLGGNARTGATRLLTVPDPQRDPFHEHAHRFTVFLPAGGSENIARRRAIEQLIAADRPGHTASAVEWVKPRFRVGIQSVIGFDSVVAAPPGQPLALEGRPLGRGTVVEGERFDGERRVGRTTRLGRM